MNVGKYYLDSENCTPEEREWVKAKQIEAGGGNIGFRHKKYYLFDNFRYIDFSDYLGKDYPLY